MIPWICRVQIGWELTESYWRCNDDPDLGGTLFGDGTEKKRMHMEGVVTQLDNGKRLSFLPWPQANKTGVGYVFIVNPHHIIHERARTAHR